MLRATVLFCSLCVLPPVWSQQAARPIGLVADASRAALIPGGSRTPRRPVAGDFLFPGDRLRVANGFVRFYWCGGPGRAAEYTLRGGEMAVGQEPPALAAAVPVRDCELPVVERSPEVATLAPLPDLKRNTAAGRTLEESLADLPEPARRRLLDLGRRDLRDPLARLTFATALAAGGLPREAAAQYLELAAAWRQPALHALAQDLLHSRASVRELRQPPATAAPPGGEGVIRALVIGISHYEQKDIPDLRFAARDAQRFAEYLKSPCGGSADAILLPESEARVAVIRNRYLDLMKRAGPNDTVVLFVAAHGDMQNGVPRIITYRANRQEPAINSLPLTGIRKLMYGQTAPFRQVRVFLDVCHSGHVALLEPSARRTAAGKNAAAPEFFALTATHQGPDAFAYEDDVFDHGHGVFTYFLLRALQTREASAGQRVLTAPELADYVEERVKFATWKQQRPTSFLGTALDTPIADLGKCDPAKFDKTALDALRIPPGRLKEALGRRGAPKSAAASFTPDAGGTALDRRIELEDRGEAILLKYLEGDEIPQDAVDFRSGARIFDEALRLQPGSPYLEARRDFCAGRAAIFEKRFAAAVASLENSVRLEPSAAYAYNALGIAYLEQADYRTAVLALQDAIARAPRWAYPRHNLALAYTEAGDFEMAIRTYQEAMRLAPDYSYLPYNLGLVYLRMNRPGDAEAQFLLAKAKAPWRAEPYTALAQLESAAGKRGQAEELLRYAMELPNQPADSLRAARHNLAVLLANDPKRREEALGVWLRNEGYVASDFLRAGTLEALGRDREAAAVYVRLLRDHPDHVTGHLRLAALREREHDLPGAIAELRAALAVKPESAPVLERLGAAWALAGVGYEARLNFARAAERTVDSGARKRLRQALRRLEKTR